MANTSRKLTAEQWDARAIAYEEAAEHLSLAWTDDDEEARQGDVVAVHLSKLAEMCRNKARAI